MTTLNANQIHDEFNYKIATVSDLAVVAVLLGESRRLTHEHLNHELGGLVDTAPSQSLAAEVTARIGEPDHAFILATDNLGDGVALLVCRHMESVPPVYDPQRAILCLQEFYLGRNYSERVGVGLLDMAVRWSAQKTDKSIMIVSISWQYEQSRRELLERYSEVSGLRFQAIHEDLFFLNGSAAKPRGAGRWYFAKHSELNTHNSIELTVNIRRAEIEDVPQMVSLSEKKRIAAARVQPIFWRQGDKANSLQEAYFCRLLADPSMIAFIHEGSSGRIDGFVIGLSRDQLPMIDSSIQFRRGLHIDDFALDDDGDWLTIGRELLRRVCLSHKERCREDFVVNVISGEHESSKCHSLEIGGMRHLYTWVVIPGGDEF